jgi:pyruvate dehydrogenase E1 component alpha subunit
MSTKTESLSRDTLLSWYEEMVLIRKFEEMSRTLYFDEPDKKRRITGVYLHLASGHEAVHLGAVKALGPEDHVITAYRDHGIAIARGVRTDLLMAEMMGKRTGVSGGKGGSMHMAWRPLSFWGGYAIVGGHLPLAAGIALKIRYNDEPNAVLCFLGDGASNNGYFHESLNLSAVWDLPVVWLIENNFVGMGTRIEDSTGQPELVKRAIAYGMKEGPRVDGQDVLAVNAAVREALDYARDHGPVLMEALTYRYEGHGVSDKQFDAREDLKRELEEWRERDPLLVFKAKLEKRFKNLGDDFARIENDTEQTIADAVEFAVNSPEPGYEDLIANVYVDSEFVHGAPTYAPPAEGQQS